MLLPKMKDLCSAVS